MVKDFKEMYKLMEKEINKSNSENIAMSQDYDIWLNEQREKCSDTFVCKECGSTHEKQYEYICQECGESICYWCACDLGRLGGNLTICSGCENEKRKDFKL